jgi:hypothetical protein
MTKCLLFFDFLDHDKDVEEFINGPIGISCKAENLDINFIDVSSLKDNPEQQLEDNISPNCIVIVDYGALNFGSSGMKDHYDRFIENLIKEHQSVSFIFRLTMGKQWYKDEIFDYPNVYTIDTVSTIEEWLDLFRRLI